jgi:hypothetical protein
MRAMPRAKPHFGVRLAFALPREGSFRRVSMDFAIAAGSAHELLERAKALGALEVEANPALRYLGVEDVFHVSGPVRPGAFLGAEDHEDVTTPAQAETLVTRTIAENVPAGAAATPLRAEVVYFATGTPDGDLALVATFVLRSSRGRALRDAAQVGRSPRAFTQLRDSGVVAESIELVGVRGIHKLPRRWEKGRFASDLYFPEYASARGAAERVKPKKYLTRLFTAILEQSPAPARPARRSRTARV